MRSRSCIATALLALVSSASAASAHEPCPQGSPLTITSATAAVTFPAPTAADVNRGWIEAASPARITVGRGIPWFLCVEVDSADPVLLEWSEDGRLWRPLSSVNSLALTLPRAAEGHATMRLRIRLSWDRSTPGPSSAVITYQAVVHP